jgi:hypothetical protein
MKNTGMQSFVATAALVVALAVITLAVIGCSTQNDGQTAQPKGDAFAKYGQEFKGKIGRT